MTVLQYFVSTSRRLCQAVTTWTFGELVILHNRVELTSNLCTIAVGYLLHHAPLFHMIATNLPNDSTFRVRYTTAHIPDFLQRTSFHYSTK